METTLSRLEQAATSLDALLPREDAVTVADRAQLPGIVSVLSRMSRRIEGLMAVAAAELARQSDRELGAAGIARQSGFSTPEKHLQNLAGVSFSQAKKLIDTGGLLAGSPASPPVGSPTSEPGGERVPEARWDAPLADAIREGAVTLEQAHAIRSHLGAPARADASAEWTQALIELVTDAVVHRFSPESLRKAAALHRADLDQRSAARHERDLYDGRSFTRRRLGSGMTEYLWRADPETAATVDAVLDSALSPRTGGPRFIDPDKAAEAERIALDARTREQHASDVMREILEAGAQVDPNRVLVGITQVQIAVTASDLDAAFNAAREATTGSGTESHIDDESGAALDDAPGLGAGVAHIFGQNTLATATTALRNLCTAGIVPLVYDDSGRALDVGRTERYFTRAQRQALAVRDGGCMMPGCDRPPSFTEAHHLVHWEHGGKTSTDNGILLCRADHKLLHDTGSRIENRGGEFLLHWKPTGESIPLRTKSGAMVRLKRAAVPRQRAGTSARRQGSAALAQDVAAPARS